MMKAKMWSLQLSEVCPFLNFYAFFKVRQVSYFRKAKQMLAI